jgi:hypothetical protein
MSENLEFHKLFWFRYLEITKVLKILVSIPITASEAKRCFSPLKIIKSYLRNTIGAIRYKAISIPITFFGIIIKHIKHGQLLTSA